MARRKRVSNQKQPIPDTDTERTNTMKRSAKNLLLLLSALALSAAAASAHQGEDHRILGTVKEVSDQEVVVTKKDANDVTILLTDATTYTKGKASAKHSDLTVGSRVAIQATEDGKTAVSVKIGTAKPTGS
jgi:Domain of unknown function (DUF5666)